MPLFDAKRARGAACAFGVAFASWLSFVPTSFGDAPLEAHDVEPSAPPRLAVDIDVARLREGAMGAEVEVLYLGLLTIIEGTYEHTPQESSSIDRLVWLSSGQERTVVHAFGRFPEPMHQSQRRGVAANEPTFPLRVEPWFASAESHPSESMLGLSRWFGALQVRACSPSHWVASESPPPESACAVTETSTFGLPGFDRHRGEGALVVGFPRPPIPLTSELLYAQMTTFTADVGDVVHGTMRFAAADAEAANATVAASDGGEGGVWAFPAVGRNELSATFEALRVEGDEVVRGFDVSFEDLRRLVLDVFGRAESELARPPEPTAEIDDHRARVAEYRPGIFSYGRRSEGAPPVPVLLLADDGADRTQRLVDAFAAAGIVVHVVEPDGIAPDGTALWTRFDARAREEIAERARLRPSDHGGPCEGRCVLVSLGISADLAVELATHYPERFAGVLLTNPERPLPLVPLPAIRRLPTGLPIEVAGCPNREPDCLAEQQVFARAISGLSARSVSEVLRSESVVQLAIAHGAEPVREVRPGRIDGAANASDCAPYDAPETRGRVDANLCRLALACRVGDATACDGLGDAWVEGTPEDRRSVITFRPFERACAMGQAHACGIVAGWNRVRERGFDRSLFLDRACRAGSGSSCNSLGVAFHAGTAGVRSLAAAIGWFARACSLGDPYGCGNYDRFGPSLLDEDMSDDAERRLLTSICLAGQYDACSELARSSSPTVPEAIVPMLERGCAHGVVGACADLEVYAADSPAHALVHARRCAIDDGACPAEDAPDAASRRRTLARWLREIRAACNGGDRHACVALAQLESPLAVVDRHEANEALARACERGTLSVCRTASARLLEEDAPRARALVRFACERGEDGDDCDALLGREEGSDDAESN